MLIKNGIIFIWTGTHAGIPAGWSRVTDMDDKYPKGTASATNPNTTGGSATHSHTSTAHSHGVYNHTHTIYLSSGISGGNTTDSFNTGSQYNHDHAAHTSSGIDSSSVSSPAATYSSISNDPVFYNVIYITPSTGASVIPSGVIALADSAKTKFNICDGTLGTPNLVGKFLKGASASANAGTIGGSTTNVHSLIHTHAVNHHHAASNTPDVSAFTGRSQSGPATLPWGHGHTVYPDWSYLSTGDTPSLTTTETVEPAYTGLLAVQAISNSSPEIGIICLWKGLLSAIPSGWKLCDGASGTIDMRGKHLKIVGTVGTVGATGGSNTHTHASQSHTHTSISHSHTVPNVGHSGGSASRGSGGPPRTVNGQTYHTVSTSSNNLDMSATATTADIVSNEPPYRTVAFIKLMYKIEQGAFILNML